MVATSAKIKVVIVNPATRFGRAAKLETGVKLFFLLVVWCILLVLSWPIALAVLVLTPFVWLLALPFRLAGICVAAVFALIKTLLFLPARLLGHRG